MRFDVTTDPSTGEVLQALTDFTERYDGSEPSVVRWTTGGADAHARRRVAPAAPKGPMYRVIARMWRKTVDDYARA